MKKIRRELPSSLYVYLNLCDSERVLFAIDPNNKFRIHIVFTLFFLLKFKFFEFIDQID